MTPVDGELDPLQTLLEQCIERAERDGDAGVEEVCARHPEHAATLRREIELLRGLGLLGAGGVQGDEPPTERIGDFRLVRELGAGGMGVVYLAEQVSLRRLVALKVLRGGARGAHGRVLARRDAVRVRDGRRAVHRRYDGAALPPHPVARAGGAAAIPRCRAISRR